jgi:NAD+ diphosphatase
MDDWSFAFGARQTDRAAECRADAGGIAQMLAREQTRVLPLWNGKPLISATSTAGWLRPGDPVLSEGGAPVFLGLRDGVAMFAQDISGWQPPADAPLPAPGFFDATEQHHPDAPEGWRFAELRGVMAALPAADAADAAAARSLLAWHRSHGFCASCGQPTAVGCAGWQRDCGACGTTHFPRTDPVVIMRIVAGNRILLGRSPAWPARMYSLLAGFVEPGETIEDAVRREVAEEAGVAIGEVRYLASQPWPFPSSLMIGCEGQATSLAITLDPVELEDALWLSREDLALVFAGHHPDIAPPRRGAIAASLMADWLADRPA